VSTEETKPPETAERSEGGSSPPPEAIALEPIPETPAAPSTVADLQTAVGVTPPPAAPPRKFKKPASAPIDIDPDADEATDEGPRKKRRWPLVVALSGLFGATIASFVLLGSANEQHYYLRCSAKQITAERGRSFPPWGSVRMGGAAWKPIAIPPAVECTSRDTDDPLALEGWYLDALVERATAKLAGASPGDIDLAQAELEQAMLLTRSPERRDQRTELERLLGDVTYWRAAAKVKAAAASLDEAAKRFDEAVAKRPRHASDAGAWAELARDTAAVLGAGPGGSGGPRLPPSGVPLPAANVRAPAPPGVALPVETPFIGTPPDAGVEPDAATSAIPSGGVLL
jgi:hypothetical protein